MRLRIYLTLSALCLCGLFAAAQAQTPRVEADTTFRQLLFLPAPTPRRADTANIDKAEEKRPQKFYAEDNAPPDDAPIDDLTAYWAARANFSGSNAAKPSDAVRQRLLAAFEAEPESFQRLLKFLPDDAATAERVKKMYDKALNAPPPDESWLERTREWLQFNSKYFLSDLLALTRKVKDKEGYVDNSEALSAIAKVDWPSAEPLLQAFANGSQPRSAALALTLLYRHALEENEAGNEEKYRARLQVIASDRNAPAQARDTAIEVLSLTDWTGRDEWYLSLLADETLLSPSDGSHGFSPLTTLFERDPNKWIPVMTKLVESKNRATQQAAASCLVLYAINHPRRDAILPVLRWLSDPGWINISSTYYAWFMQKLDKLDMPESVPGLIWIVENDELHRQWAARTLAHYKDPRAIPALRKALMQGAYEDQRPYFIQGLLASGAVPEAEQLAALEAYAAKIVASKGSEELLRYRPPGDDPLPVPVSIGKYLAFQKDVPESLVTQVLIRVESLQKEKPELARTLLEVAQRWQVRQVDVDMVRRIAEGKADATTIASALERRVRLLENAGAELRTLAGSSGSAQGIAAALLADETLTQSILGAEDQSSQIALLACARLMQMPLPISQVGVLLRSKNSELALAAERYLLAEDSAEARQLLWAHYPDKAFITGWRENILLIGGSNFEAMGKAEDALRAELFKENAPTEIFALLENEARPLSVLRVYPDRAVYTRHDDAARYRERVITKEELAQFKNFLITSQFAESGPQIDYCHHDCALLEFLSLARTGGRRVFSHQGMGAWISLFTNFDSLAKGKNLKIHYNLEKVIKGLEVLLADETLSAKDVWKQGTDLRVLIERAETPEESEQEQKANTISADEDDEEAARAELLRQEIARAKARISWRSFINGKLGSTTQQPHGYSTFDTETFELDRNDPHWHLDEPLNRAIAGKFLVLAGTYTKGGLWKKTIGGNAVQIGGEGKYMNPVVTPDGKWVVAAKTDTDWSTPNYVVRLNLQTQQEHRVKLPPAEEFAPVAYVAAHGKILLRRARDVYDSGSKAVGPEVPEFYLLDTETGKTEMSAGVFSPLEQTGRRFLQPTGESNEFWAAIPDGEKNQTRVGRYNTKAFSFQTLLVVPHLMFDSMAMWVDEEGAKLYLVYEGQLLRLPFPANHALAR